MKSLIDYLEIVGQATGEKILEYMGEGWDTTELFLLVEEGRVSSNYGMHGHRYFRYPAVGSIPAGAEEETGSELVSYLRRHPNQDGKEIMSSLGWSKDKFLRRSTPLLESGQVVRTKNGVSWLYSLAVKAPITPKSDPFKHIPKPAAVEQRNGRFARELIKRELSETEKRILEAIAEFPDDDREADHMMEDLGVVSKEAKKDFMQCLSKLYRDGYIGKVVDDDYTFYCLIEKV